MEKEHILKELYKLKNEAIRLYEENGKNDFDAGRVDGFQKRGRDVGYETVRTRSTIGGDGSLGAASLSPSGSANTDRR